MPYSTIKLCPSLRSWLSGTDHVMMTHMSVASGVIILPVPLKRASWRATTPDSLSRNSRSKNPRAEILQGFPLSGGASPLGDTNRIGPNLKISGPPGEPGARESGEVGCRPERGGARRRGVGLGAARAGALPCAVGDCRARPRIDGLSGQMPTRVALGGFQNWFKPT